MSESDKRRISLLEEKKLLTKILSTFEEQLNRLKIEEMALMSYIKMEAEQASNLSNSCDSYQEDVKPISSFQNFSEAAEINNEALDLKVRDIHGDQMTLNLNCYQIEIEEGMDDDDEEEEEEDYDDDIKFTDEGSKSYMLL